MDRTTQKTAAFKEIRESGLAAETIRRDADYQLPTAPSELLEAAAKGDQKAIRSLRMGSWMQR